ncbi:MAG TPA: protein phosphatase 2C domain-containing protein, partial [Ilumatobacteraceae bacterium]|nr:protein phosphatase 2C domain-containing protein [Ilumatobacteraceae bacterium]
MSDDELTEGREPVLAWGAATHTGMVRDENEDSYVAENKVFGVADGMGGHQAGEVASAIAATILRDRLPNGASVDLMVAAVVEANSAIFQAAHTHAEQRGMGTTLTTLALVPVSTPARVVIANVGDSRTYLLRNGRLRRVTVDHSYVQELVNTGHITEHR